jgi:hypothetical protein
MTAPRLLRSRALRRGTSRAFVIVLLVIAIISALGSVALSPALMVRFGHGGTQDSTTEWERLGNIGQTYGAASAMLSVLALIGVTVSLILQARESRGPGTGAPRIAL